MKKVTVDYVLENDKISITLNNGEIFFRTYSDLNDLEKKHHIDYDPRFVFKKDQYIEIKHDLLHLCFLNESRINKWDYFDIEALSLKTAYQDNNYLNILDECFTFLEAKAKFYYNDVFLGEYPLVVYNRKITKAKIDCLISWISNNEKHKKLFNNMNHYFLLKKESRIVSLHEIGLETFLENNGILSESSQFDIDVECFVNQKSIGSVGVNYF